MKKKGKEKIRKSHFVDKSPGGPGASPFFLFLERTYVLKRLYFSGLFQNFQNILLLLLDW